MHDAQSHSLHAASMFTVHCSGHWPASCSSRCGQAAVQDMAPVCLASYQPAGLDTLPGS